jgi:hypothetical protein
MILTIQNKTALPLAIAFPIQRTLDAFGGAHDTVALGVNMRDLVHGEEKGDSAYLRLNLLRQKGTITMSIAANATTSDILDQANSV